MGKVATSPLPSRGSSPVQSVGQSQKWLTCGQSGYVTLPSRGSPPLQRGGQSQKWPTCGQSGCVTPAVSGIPTASERGAKSEVAHLWARWLRHPCRLGDPRCFTAGGKNQNWSTCGHGGYVTRAISGIPQNQKWPTCGESGYVTPAVSGMPTASKRGATSEVAHLWAKWLCHPCRLGDPHRLRVEGKVRSGTLVGKVAMSRLPSRGCLPLHSRGQIRSGTLVGKVAMSRLPSRGSLPLHSRGQNQKWHICGQSGYVTPAVSGMPTAS